jgi:hypothetical protein
VQNLQLCSDLNPPPNGGARIRDSVITLDTYSHAIPALQEEAAALIAGLVFAGK